MNNYYINDAPVYDIEFDDEFKNRVICIIKNSLKGRLTSVGDAAILFHWLRHQDDPAYAFVPEKYRRRRDAKNR